MFTGSINSHAQSALTYYHNELTTLLVDRDVISYIGDINFFSPTVLKEVIEFNKTDKTKLAVLIYSGGGSVESAEKMVQIMRFHYEDVIFIIPEMAMSAATIMCMSGNEIYMDYSSSLGPIDPQVQNKEGIFVPALGYLDKAEEIINKSSNNICSPAELMLLSNMDLGMLRRYEQARDLSIVLLKQWLVKYKFSDWTHHSDGVTLVTDEERENRASEIATKFCDHNHWHSHSRYISMDELINSNIKLKINDFGMVSNLSFAIRKYHDLLLDYFQGFGKNFYIHCNTHLQGM
ncbi:ATP-dependent Clp protease proteolytic subunit [uncultured Acinetobacter sp.]|uniref:SDH family Clp fold serine proteinase n=1 Tax=uncultured Acinetobacter sp. TaxID=165433 RepID=UPI00258E7BA3|nr:ATP-dependent Clp protease proteolytic subunit [uncultured Acinetobacter sp.]